MSSDPEDDNQTQIIVNAVNDMDHEEEEEDQVIVDAIHEMDWEEEEEDQFLANVPYEPPSPEVPHITDDDPLVAAAVAGDDDNINIGSPDYTALPTPQQPGEKPCSNLDYVNYADDTSTIMHNITTDEMAVDIDIPLDFSAPWNTIPQITAIVGNVIPDNTMEGAVQSIIISFKDQHGENSDEDRRLLEATLDDIAFATGYVAGYYITKRQNYLMENDIMHRDTIRFRSQAMLISWSQLLQLRV